MDATAVLSGVFTGLTWLFGVLAVGVSVFWAVPAVICAALTAAFVLTGCQLGRITLTGHSPRPPEHLHWLR